MLDGPRCGGELLLFQLFQLWERGDTFPHFPQLAAQRGLLLAQLCELAL
jgi:hypothetical protein